jgi:tripartite-type tricarboxylate transporter receptor subunit TctC
VLPAISRAALAQAYSTRPLRLIVGFVLGGPNDILARLLREWLAERWAPIVVENLPGAPAIRRPKRWCARRPTAIRCSSSSNASPASLSGSSFDLLRDIAPVAGITREALVMVVHPSVRAKTVRSSSPMRRPIGQDQDGHDQRRQLAA